MKIHFAGQSYDCARAVKDGQNATLYLEEGGTVTYSGVHNWEAFTLEDGDWSLPDIAPEEQLRADVDFLAIMTGVSLE